MGLHTSDDTVIRWLTRCEIPSESIVLLQKCKIPLNLLSVDVLIQLGQGSSVNFPDLGNR